MKPKFWWYWEIEMYFPIKSKISDTFGINQRWVYAEDHIAKQKLDDLRDKFPTASFSLTVVSKKRYTYEPKSS